ncbi:MAG: sigma-70 family RNA polymerase sigma factor [Eubacterium sp.]|nr:sigma-70 family RNA polymerase sigma factor [Eubacterium sp.]
MISAIISFLSANIIYFILHLQNTSSFPKPLKPKEEAQYIERKLQGDKEARAVLIERNLRLVSHIIKKYYSKTNDTDDLISIGTIGLIKAIDSFDNSKGTRLATYASRCIENAILTQRILLTVFSLKTGTIFRWLKNGAFYPPIIDSLCFTGFITAKLSTAFSFRIGFS